MPSSRVKTPGHHHELRLTVALRKVLAEARGPENAKNPVRPLTLGLIIETTGQRAFGVLMAFICLPFVQPIPLPGLSIPFGIALALLGAQLALRRHRPWLPKRLLALKVPQRFGLGLIGMVARIFRPLERIVRPRLLVMQNPLAMVLVGTALVFDGLLLVFLPAFPGSNVIPAWIALITILGITEEDGIALLAGTILTLAAAIGTPMLLFVSWKHIAH